MHQEPASDDDALSLSQSLTATMFESFLKGAGFVRSADLRKVFIENYGVQIDLPAYYYLDAKFVPHHPNMIVVLAWHIIPNSASTKLFTKFINDEEVYENFYDEVYEKYGNKVILQLLKINK